MKSLNLIFIHNSTGSRLYRILPQAKYMASIGHNCKVRGLKSGERGGIPQSDLEWADAVVMEMVYSVDFLKICKKNGVKIIYELDDLMEKVPSKHYASKEMNLTRTYYTYKCLNMADAITCTSERLKDRYKKFNSNIYVLPNYFEIDFWEKEHLPNDSDMIRLIWAGGNSHTEDLEFIQPVIKRVLDKYKNVKFISCGHGGASSDDEWVKFNYGEKLFGDLPKDQYEFSLGAPMEVWPSKLNSLRGDIAIAPVVENEFSRCKSQCKFGEYSLNRIPGVYSQFLYKDVDNGITGLTAKEDSDDWFNKICYLIENEKERKEIGENAYEWVKRNWNFKKHAYKWEEVYTNHINKKNSKK